MPVCFVLLGDVVYHAVDDKPRRHRELRRLANLRSTGEACLLVDEYRDHWSALWWVRLDVRGRIVDDPAEATEARAALSAKYPQYAGRPPAAPWSP